MCEEGKEVALVSVPFLKQVCKVITLKNLNKIHQSKSSI